MSLYTRIWYCLIVLGSIPSAYGKNSREELAISLFTKLREIRFKPIKKSKKKAKGVKTSMKERRTLKDVLQRAHVKAEVIPKCIKEEVRKKVKNPIRSSVCDKVMGIKLINKNQQQEEISFSLYPLLAHLLYSKKGKIRGYTSAKEALEDGVTLEYLNALDSVLTMHMKRKEQLLLSLQNRAFQEACKELLGSYAIRRQEDKRARTDKRAPKIVIQPIESEENSEAPLEQISEVPLTETIPPSSPEKESILQKGLVLLGALSASIVGKKMMQKKKDSKKTKLLPARGKSSEHSLVNIKEAS